LPEVPPAGPFGRVATQKKIANGNTVKVGFFPTKSIHPCIFAE
jgi:hypothetical protein